MLSTRHLYIRGDQRCLNFRASFVLACVSSQSKQYLSYKIFEIFDTINKCMLIRHMKFYE